MKTVIVKTSDGEVCINAVEYGMTTAGRVTLDRAVDNPDVVVVSFSTQERSCSTCLYCQINPSSEGEYDRYKCVQNAIPVKIPVPIDNVCDLYENLTF